MLAIRERRGHVPDLRGASLARWTNATSRPVGAEGDVAAQSTPAPIVAETLLRLPTSQSLTPPSLPAVASVVPSAADADAEHDRRSDA